MNYNQQFESNFMNAVNIVALMIGFQNLFENRQQSEQNDVNAANDKQAQFLLTELNKKFDEQNKMLSAILDILRENDAP